MGLADWLFSPHLGRKLSPRHLKIRAKILDDPYYRFQSNTEIAIAAELGIKIDVNQAGVDDWLRLPGLSIHQARSLVELTGMGVQFFCLEDLAAALSVPVTRLNVWEPLLHFCYYHRETSLHPQRINPNLASVTQLSQIPLLEEAIAQRIVSNRLARGKYSSFADLQYRLELDPELVSQLMHYLQF
ncbi:MAG: ComEA family DNA-binding protein [Okeania sp. SIO2D1]|nr:ComEA family DNA-binding protein [Okeania sp. SIO2D1]